MKHLVILLLGLLAFTACSKDNEEGMSPTLSEKKKDYIAKIEFFYKPLGNNVKDYEKAGEYTFTYDKQKRLVDCTFYYNEFDDGHKRNCKMSYSENQIEFHKLESTYKGKRRYPEDFFIILDKQGKALQVNTYLYGSYLHLSNREYFKYIDAFFKYDSLGHCTSFAQEGFPSIIPLVWKNGNIESILYHTKGGYRKLIRSLLGLTKTIFIRTFQIGATLISTYSLQIITRMVAGGLFGQMLLDSVLHTC